MTAVHEKQSRSSKPHPYLHGNFAPIHRVQRLTPCTFIGAIPVELTGGEYVRNGGNPVANEDLGRDAHWFDGDGMLSGVAFRRTGDGSIQPEFVNQYILTDVYLSTITTPSLRLPILPSIATLVNPAASLFTVILRIFRTVLIIILSNLPGSEYAVKKLSVANTGILYHDGRALATCESGPPMRISLPGLETVGWYDGCKAEGEPLEEHLSKDTFGGHGLLSWMKQWTTAHPRTDPITNDLILFHSNFVAPFVHYSVIPSTKNIGPDVQLRRLTTVPVPGINSAKMMHDFGVSLTHTVIMDLPLSLDPRNLALGQPAVLYNYAGKSRFGVFPRWNPDAIRWFETNPCCIFHTANTWDEIVMNPDTNMEETVAVNMLASRLTSAALVYSAGDIAAPVQDAASRREYAQEEEQCRLYYYRFSLAGFENEVTHQFALSAIPFEFPSLRGSVSMSSARFIYGCSVSDGSFGAALGRAVKIDALVKIDAKALISQAETLSPTPVTGCIDNRSVSEVLASTDLKDPIKIFKLPPGFYAQESRFVPRENGDSEDDGWILSYVFDEGQLDKDGNVGSGAKSELWVIDAKGMKEVVCRVLLPQRVPYGLHGNWFSEDEIQNQRPITTIRHFPIDKGKILDESGVEPALWIDIWRRTRRWALKVAG